MLLEAILGIIAISVVFCCCTFFCVVVFHFIFTEEKSDAPGFSSDSEPWEAKHYYDPLPLSTPSPPDTIFKPTPYTFKLQNGNGVYPTGLPHAVINPAVLQYPPGHVLDQQRVPPRPPQSQSQPSRQPRGREPVRRNSIIKLPRSRSPSPSPGARRAKNVWSTNTEFQNPNNYYQQYYFQQQRHNNFYNQQQQNPQSQEFQRQYVQLTQEHYPVQVQQKHIRFQPEEYLRQQKDDDSPKHQNQREMAQYEPFMASSHATNVYTQHHSPQRKNSRSHHSKSKSRHKEAVT